MKHSQVVWCHSEQFFRICNHICMSLKTESIEAWYNDDSLSFVVVQHQIFLFSYIVCAKSLYHSLLTQTTPEDCKADHIYTYMCSRSKASKEDYEWKIHCECFNTVEDLVWQRLRKEKGSNDFWEIRSANNTHSMGWCCDTAGSICWCRILTGKSPQFVT